MITIGSIRDVGLDLARALPETNWEAGFLAMPQAARVAAANGVLQGAAIKLAADSEVAGVAAQAALNLRTSADALSEQVTPAADNAAQIGMATASDGDSVAGGVALRLVATADATATARVTLSNSSPRRAP